MRVSGARPLYGLVSGSPFQPGDKVRVVGAIDQEVQDTTRWLGMEGSVVP